MAFSFCPRCGTPRLGAFRFCRQCELDFDALTFSPNAPPTPPALLAEPDAPAEQPPQQPPIQTPEEPDRSGLFLWSLSGASLAGIVWLWLNVGPYDPLGKVLTVAIWGALWIGIVAAFLKFIGLVLSAAGRVVGPFRRPK
jgi:hypothetical protein